MPAVSIPWAAQVAVAARLRAHFATQSLTWPVLDHAPQNQPFPFVQLGMVAAQDVSGVLWRATQVVIPVQGFANAHKGQMEAHALNAEVRAALDEREADLVLSHGQCVRCHIASQTVDREGDGLTYIASSIVTLTIEH